MPNQGFDVVIAGAGSAGCVLANRLSEDPACSVLLVEAGPDYPDPSNVPPEIADGRGLAGTHDWGYESEPDGRGIALTLPRGRIVGGSSAVNACVALRGHPADYDAWAARGNPDWSWREVLPSFRAIERDLDFGERAWHGLTGELPIRRYGPAELTPLHQGTIEAAVRAGHAYVEDLNEPATVGAGSSPVNCVDGRRISAALAFLAVARRRPNLTILANALVDRVDTRSGRAVGLRLAGRYVPIEADLVIVAAGAYGSPAVLLRSGIGPAPELKALGIEPVVDLPGVGRHLVDHPGASLEFPLPAGHPLWPKFQSVVTTWSAGADRSGAPDLQLLGSGPWEDAGSRTGLGGTLSVSVVKPVSEGRLWLRSPDPADPPHIELCHLGADVDLARMVEVLREARRIAEMPPLAGLVDLSDSEPDAHTSHDERRLRDWLRDNVWSYHHPVGSCRMGPRPTAGDVVDARGHVHGVPGLAVVDASVMPEIPSANTNLPTLMLAQHLSSRVVP